MLPSSLYPLRHFTNRRRIATRRIVEVHLLYASSAMQASNPCTTNICTVLRTLVQHVAEDPVGVGAYFVLLYVPYATALGSPHSSVGECTSSHASVTSERKLSVPGLDISYNDNDTRSIFRTDKTLLLRPFHFIRRVRSGCAWRGGATRGSRSRLSSFPCLSFSRGAQGCWTRSIELGRSERRTQSGLRTSIGQRRCCRARSSPRLLPLPGCRHPNCRDPRFSSGPQGLPVMSTSHEKRVTLGGSLTFWYWYWCHDVSLSEQDCLCCRGRT